MYNSFIQTGRLLFSNEDINAICNLNLDSYQTIFYNDHKMNSELLKNIMIYYLKNISDPKL